MNSNDFYSKLPSFSNFSKLIEDDFFKSAPENWDVIITDIRGSTKAIQSGKYKQVNMLGAACITCASNTIGSMNFPFVFGGDGATMVLAPDITPLVIEELQQLKSLSLKKFGLELRVGTVKVKSLYQKGASLLLGKYELSPGNCVAQFKGGALTLAEDMIKNEAEGATIYTSSSKKNNPQLTGLSCRISPISSSKGIILTLLMKPNKSENSNSITQQFIEDIQKTLNHDLRDANPIQLSQLKWRWPPQTLLSEAKFLKSLKSAIYGSLLSWILLKFNIKAADFEPQKYKNELVQNSDFKKFDETLRMVLDCTTEQCEEIENILKKLYASNLATYGVHKSTHALLTCIVKSASQNSHIHFVDGSNGGYAVAALQMKSQAKSLKET